MLLSEEQIKEINNKSPYDQGIFKEPYGINTNIKEPVIYMRWVCRGMSGGSYWGSEPTYFKGDSKPSFKVLDLVLEAVKPQITYLQYKQIEGLIEKADYSDLQYYGNYDDYEVEYIVLSKLEELLKTF